MRNFDKYDSVFDYAIDKAAEEREKLKETQRIQIDYDVTRNLVCVNGVECTPKAFFAFTANLVQLYCETIYAVETRSFAITTTSKEIPDGRNLVNHLKFYTYLDGGVRIVGEFTNEISDTIEFDRTFKNGSMIVRYFVEKGEQIARSAVLG